MEQEEAQQGERLWTRTFIVLMAIPASSMNNDNAGFHQLISSSSSLCSCE